MSKCGHCGHSNKDGFCRPEPRKGPEAYFCRQRGLIGEQTFAPEQPAWMTAVEQDEAVVASAKREAEALARFQQIDAEWQEALGTVAELNLRTRKDEGTWQGGAGWRASKRAKEAARELPNAERHASELNDQRDAAAVELRTAKDWHRYEHDRAMLRHGRGVMFPTPMPGTENVTRLPRELFGGDAS